jgi:hypothetical protein
VAQFEVDLCPNAAILNLTNYRLSYDYYFQTTGGTRFSPDPTDITDGFLANNNGVITGCAPSTEPGTDEWLQGECANLPASMTNLTIIFRIQVPWAGVVFLDNVKFTPK